jgi:hypothetical protein
MCYQRPQVVLSPSRPLARSQLTLFRLLTASECVWLTGCSLSVKNPQSLDLTSARLARMPYLCSASHTFALPDLPGFTRSVYARDHALITPESRVFAPLFGWRNSPGAVLVSPKATGAHFTMTLVNMGAACDSRLRNTQTESWPGANATSAAPLPGVERFVYVLEGILRVAAAGEVHVLSSEGFTFIPPELEHSCVPVSPRAGLA